MNRRQWMMLSGAAAALRPQFAAAQRRGIQPPTEPVSPENLLLKDYYPKSVFKIPVSNITKGKFPIVDVHHHASVRTPEDVEKLVKQMDTSNVERIIAFSMTGERFDNLVKLYAKYPKRFDVWCGLDMRDVGEPTFGAATLKELERCRKAGAVGVGEISDKGMGIGGSMGGPGRGGAAAPARSREGRAGAHPDDARMDAVWQKCAEFGMPINLHMSDPYWSYLPQDQYNDGLMNEFSWRLDNKPGILGHDGLIASLEKTLEKHSKTVFIACHHANLDCELTRLGEIFDRHPNLYVDNSARFCEMAAIPRAYLKFLKKYGHRVCYGTDMPYTPEILNLTYRLMESDDEHFYARQAYFNFDYHWPMHGFALPDDILRKMYRENALAAFKLARSSARG